MVRRRLTWGRRLWRPRASAAEARGIVIQLLAPLPIVCGFTCSGRLARSGPLFGAPVVRPAPWICSACSAGVSSRWRVTPRGNRSAGPTRRVAGRRNSERLAFEGSPCHGKMGGFRATIIGRISLAWRLEVGIIRMLRADYRRGQGFSPAWPPGSAARSIGTFVAWISPCMLGVLDPGRNLGALSPAECPSFQPTPLSRCCGRPCQNQVVRMVFALRGGVGS